MCPIPADLVIAAVHATSPASLAAHKRAVVLLTSQGSLRQAEGIARPTRNRSARHGKEDGGAWWQSDQASLHTVSMALVSLATHHQVLAPPELWGFWHARELEQVSLAKQSVKSVMGSKHGTDTALGTSLSASRTSHSRDGVGVSVVQRGVTGRGMG